MAQLEYYTCPMHPEVRQIGPGSCPSCGMALEPLVATAEVSEDHELKDMTRRFWFAAVFTLPLFIISMLIPHLFSDRLRVWLELLLATPVCLWSGWPFFVRATDSIKRKSLNMFTLIGLGVSVSYAYSLIATVVPHIFPPSFQSAEGHVAVYFEVQNAL